MEQHLTPNEWLEGCASFIADARGCIRRAKQGEFGREYWLPLAEHRIVNAEHCLNHAIISQDIIDFF